MKPPLPRRQGLLRAWFVLLAFTVGCVVFEAPYRAPLQISAGQEPIDEATLIPYRTLVESDFKAPKFPSDGTAKYVEALTAVIIRVPPVQLHVFERTTADSSYFEAVPDSFHFEARMSQTHSWLNPNHKGTILHILGHEQVHFAISELAARRANSEMDAIRARIRSTARVDSVALRLAGKRFNDELVRVRKEAADRNIEFDKNSENGQRFYRNDLWIEKIKKELEETAPASEASPH